MAPGGQRYAERRKSNVGGLQRQRSGLQDDPQQKATIAYIKRILCSKPPIQDAPETVTNDGGESLESLLPPLTSSNDIDIEFYALIAVILANFVQVWYNRITPDQDFLKEIVQIIAHCTRGLEQRLRKVDLESLVLDELPGLLLEHIHGKAATISRCQQTIADEKKRSECLDRHALGGLLNMSSDRDIWHSVPTQPWSQYQTTSDLRWRNKKTKSHGAFFWSIECFLWFYLRRISSTRVWMCLYRRFSPR